MALTTAALLLAAVSAPADIVYLKDGRTYEGKTVPTGDNVTIETALGNLVVPASDITYIEPKAVSTSKPSSSPPPASTQPSQIDVSVEKLTRPESIVYMLMRRLPTTPKGSESFELRQQIDAWRAMEHDGKRRVGTVWMSTEDFAHHREGYPVLLKDVQDQLAKYKRPTTPAPKPDQSKFDSASAAKIRLAAGAWADPVLRAWLSGIAEYNVKSYTQATVCFRAAVTAAPRVAAFRQGLALALIADDKGLDAVTVMTDAVQFAPDSPELLSLLKYAMEKTPGNSIKAPAYQNAEKLLMAYDGVDTYDPAKMSFNWLLPGRSLSHRDVSLPTPPYDRLVFRQAVAVPISDKTLLVDGEAVKDALEVFVRVGPKLLVPATVRKVSAYGSTAAPPLAVLTVKGYSFTPVTVDAKEALEAGTAVTIAAASINEEMGGDIRKTDAKITAVAADGSPTLDRKLLPGESAAPVLTKARRLVCFLAAKSNAFVEDGGPDKVIPLSQIAPIAKPSTTSFGDSSSYGRIKRTVTTQPAAGDSFQVYITAGEGK